MTEKIHPASSMNLKPTSKQVRAITKLAISLNITEPIEETPRNRREARNLIYQLRIQLRERENNQSGTF